MRGVTSRVLTGISSLLVNLLFVRSPLSLVLGFWFVAIGFGLGSRPESKEARTTDQERERLSTFIPSGWQNKMRLWRLVRLVRHFFVSPVESDDYAVEKPAKSRDFPKSVTFLNAFPK